MRTAASNDKRIQNVDVTDDQNIAHLVGGRVISAPLAWSWRLSEATSWRRARYRLSGSGQEVRWPDIDEDISVEGLLHGIPGHRPRSRSIAGKVIGHDPGSVKTRVQPSRRRV